MSHCVYCGRQTRSGDVCRAHADLPDIEREQLGLRQAQRKEPPGAPDQWADLRRPPRRRRL